MSKYILEACVDSVDSAVSADRGGADRLELCGNLVIGGTTPSQALFKEIRKHTDIRIHALIRPRFGDFCYSDSEFEVILEEVRDFRSLGAEGVVYGVLNPDGTLNLKQMDMLRQAAGDMWVTLHRAFDVCADPYEALRQAKELGVNTILTSGQGNTCMAGKELIKELVDLSRDEMEILVGGGVNADVIRQIHPEVKAHAYHMSGKVIQNSAMVYRKEGVNMGLPSISEFQIFKTDEENIREARRLLDEL